MVHIRIQHGIAAEGLILTDEHHKQHAYTGNGIGQRKIIQFDGFAQGQLHRDPSDR